MMTRMQTESPNPNSEQVDQLDALAIVDLINDQDRTVAAAVATQRSAIAQAIELVASTLARGGRLIYVGAGTSGRLGVLDASECPPTFSTSPQSIIGIIAGGEPALTQAIEGAEDDVIAAVEDLQRIDFSSRDLLFGIATSGQTPYVLAAVAHARSIGAATVGLTCNEATPLHALVDVIIAPIVGPEVITGSTRMKAGTATKMILNMVTTGTMIRLGKTYGNLMVDLRATNAKLKRRCVRIVCGLTDLGEADAQSLLGRTNGEVKTAIVAHRCHVSVEVARERLAQAEGRLRTALELE